MTAKKKIGRRRNFPSLFLFSSFPAPPRSATRARKTPRTRSAPRGPSAATPSADLSIAGSTRGRRRMEAPPRAARCLSATRCGWRLRRGECRSPSRTGSRRPTRGPPWRRSGGAGGSPAPCRAGSHRGCRRAGAKAAKVVGSGRSRSSSKAGFRRKQRWSCCSPPFPTPPPFPLLLLPLLFLP